MLVPLFFTFEIHVGYQNGSFLSQVELQFRIAFSKCKCLSSISVFGFHSPFPKNQICVFSYGVSTIFASFSFYVSYTLYTFVVSKSDALKTPKRVKLETKIAPKSFPNFDAFYHRHLIHFGPFGTPKFAPNPPPGPCWPTWALLGCILAAQGSPSPFWVRMGSFGALKGSICTPFWPLMDPF